MAFLTVGNRTRFWVTTWFNLAGFLATFFFLPGAHTMLPESIATPTHTCNVLMCLASCLSVDAAPHRTEVTGLDLSELDRWWYHIKRGEVNGYHGIAVSPQHLSPVEKWVMKYHKNFDLEKDAGQRSVRGTLV